MKKFIIGVSVFVVLLIAAAFAFPFLFKDRIIQAAKDAANQEINAVLNFEDIDVSLLQNLKNFPNVTLVIYHPSIVGINQFQGDTLIKMNKLMLALDIKSLFQTEKPISIQAIDFIEANIYAKIALDGSSNWDITKETVEDKESLKFSLDIENINLENVNITYIDVPGNSSMEILSLNHNAKGNFTDNLVKYKSETSIQDLSYYSGLVPYLKNVKLKNKSEIEIDQAAKKYKFSDNQIDLNELSIILNGYVQQMDQEAMSMSLNFKTENNDFKSVLSLIPTIYKQDFNTIETKGTFDLKGKVEGLYRKTIYPKMDIVFNVLNGEFHYPDLPQRVSKINIISSIKSSGGTLDNMIIDVQKFEMNIGNDPFEGRLRLQNPMSNPYIELYSKGKINLADVQKFYPMDGVKKLEGLVNIDLNLKAKKSDLQAKNYNAIQAVGTAQIKGMYYESATVEKPVRMSLLTLNFTPQYVEVPACIGNIGATDFNIKGRFENFIGYYLSKDEVMHGTINFTSQNVDMNEFSANNSDAKAEYVMVPAKINFTGNATIKEMKYGTIIIKNIDGGMNVKEEKINLTNVNAELLGGKAKMNAIYSTVGQTKPITAVNYEIESFDIAEVYNYIESAPKLAPILKYMTGKLSSNSNLTMNLLPDMSPDLSTLDGDFSVSIPFARIINLPALNQIAEVTKLQQLTNLEATNIKANMSFDKGRIIMQPANFKANNMDINISGFQGLDKSIDYKMALDVPFSKLGNAAGVVNGLISKFKLPFIGNMNPETIRLNMNIKGFFDKPTVSLGAPEILTGGKSASASSVAIDAVKNTGEDLKNQALKTADSIKLAAMNEAQRKANELREEGEKKVEEAKRKAEEEVNNKKEELLKELKKKLPW